VERRSKIVATLGPGTSKEETIRDLVRFGVDVTRLNFSHGEHETHLKDIQGPKIRIGEVVGETELIEGNRLAVAPGDFLGDASRLSTPYKQVIHDVKLGHRILLDDGLLELRVEEVEDSEIECVVVTGGPISSHKGMNFPDSSLSISGLTPKDLEDLRFGVEELRPDWIAASFVRSGAEVEEIKERISEFGGSGIPLISKVEKHEAIDDIENILKASDGIMVARGDLAVELSAERVPIEQKRIVARCRRLGKPVIVATQMLDSMIRNPRPTRAEVSDVANAIFDRADAVMLSGETAIGRYPLESVRVMDRICREAEEAINYGRDIVSSTDWGRGDRYDALTHAACELAEDLGLEAIITSTQSGLSCLRVARFRPPNKIVAVSPEESTVRMLAMVWGVNAVNGEQRGGIEERYDEAVHAARKAGLVKEDDEVILTGGSMSTMPGSTNMLKLHKIGEE
jgi:pyruvate kinase